MAHRYTLAAGTHSSLPCAAALHHLAEVSLLRDLYRSTGGARLTWCR